MQCADYDMPYFLFLAKFFIDKFADANFVGWDLAMSFLTIGIIITSCKKLKVHTICAISLEFMCYNLCWLVLTCIHRYYQYTVWYVLKLAWYYINANLCLVAYWLYFMIFWLHLLMLLYFCCITLWCAVWWNEYFF